LDGNKLLLKQVVDDYTDLQSVDTSIIDNGDFDRNMRYLMYDIRKEATNARLAEGDTSGPIGWYGSFEAWDSVFDKCQHFREDFATSPKVDWARRKMTQFTWKRRIEGFVVGLAASIVAGLIWFLAK